MITNKYELNEFENKLDSISHFLFIFILILKFIVFHGITTTSEGNDLMCYFISGFIKPKLRIIEFFGELSFTFYAS